jgi:hypothetical protein
MSNYSPRLVDKLNALANEYAPLIYQSITKVLSERQYNWANTTLGQTELKVHVVPGDEKKAPNIVVQFDDRYMFLEKRKMQWTRFPNMSKMLEWAERKLPGDPKGAKKIAWAKAWDMAKNDSWRRKPWMKKSLGDVMREMNQMIVQGFDKAIEEDMQAAASA